MSTGPERIANGHSLGKAWQTHTATDGLRILHYSETLYSVAGAPPVLNWWRHIAYIGVETRLRHQDVNLSRRWTEALHSGEPEPFSRRTKLVLQLLKVFDRYCGDLRPVGIV